MIYPHRFRKQGQTLLDDYSKRKNIQFEGQWYSANDIIEMALNDPEKYMRLENSKRKKNV